ncbi:hypothetical protein ACFHYQ_08325 [Sphaerimonospora cavernae]|uniref:Uncharacterized protein n=1 Tax=Sphaerimonospora cavernae TaxID=1740611 RepID=A0ABV6U367_9ACTN
MNTSARATLAIIPVPKPLLTARGGSGFGTEDGGSSIAGKGQPDVNGDGTGVIGVTCPGDIHDNSYYQSFADDANKIDQAGGWEIRTIDRLNPADAVNQARDPAHPPHPYDMTRPASPDREGQDT